MKNKIIKISNCIFGENFTQLLYEFYISLRFLEPRENDLELILKYVGKGDVVIDVGANIGKWTITFAKHVGQNGQVFAFEPITETYNFLYKKTHKYKQIITFNCGLSDISEKKEILVPFDIRFPTSAALSDTADQIKNRNILETRMVNTMRLDDITKDFKKINLIKIDVEGHELNVLKGGIATINKYKPIIYMEILREKWHKNKPSLSDASLCLESMGYKIGQLTNNGILFNENSFDMKRENFIFIFKS